MIDEVRERLARLGGRGGADPAPASGAPALGAPASVGVEADPGDLDAWVHAPAPGTGEQQLRHFAGEHPPTCIALLRSFPDLV